MDCTWVLESPESAGNGKHPLLAIQHLPYRIGRSKDNDLVIANLGLSRTHASINRDISGHLRLVDENSTNGSFVNHRRIDGYCLLHDNDIIHFAGVEFRLRHVAIGPPDDPAFDDARTQLLPDNAILSEHFARHEREFMELIGGKGLSGAFQPIVTARSRQIVGYELLGRADHPHLPKTPIELFNLAGTLNREADLSLAFREFGASRFASMAEQKMLFINAHPKETFHRGFLASLRQLCSVLPAHSLVVEIHESTVTDIGLLRELGTELSDMGIRFAYDDFGSRQARLLELADVPAHFVKFDMSLIRGLHHAGQRKQQIVSDLVKMVSRIDAVPLAEGVESEDEASACLDMGFELFQGYLTGAPIPANAL